MISRFLDWCAYRLVMILPVSSKLFFWLLPYAGRHAFDDVEDEQETR